MGLILRDLLARWHTSFIDSSTYSISSTNMLFQSYCTFQIELSFPTGYNVLFLHPSTICFNNLPMAFLKHTQLLGIILQSVIEFICRGFIKPFTTVYGYHHVVCKPSVLVIDLFDLNILCTIVTIVNPYCSNFRTII